MVFSDFEESLRKLSAMNTVNEIMVIGGSSLIELSVNKYKDHCKLLIVTRINKDYECDVFMPKIEESDAFTKIFIS